MDGAHWVSAGGASLARWRLPAALSPTIQQVAVWGQPARPATNIKDHPVMTQKKEDVPSTATIDRLGSSLPQRTNGVPEGPDYVMDVGRTYQFGRHAGIHPTTVRRLSARPGRGLTTGEDRNQHCVFVCQTLAIGYLQRELKRCVLAEARGRRESRTHRGGI